MEAILRTLFIYFFLLLLMRLTGKRTLSEMSAFDFVILLIISEATQAALIDSDHSLTNAAIVITTFMAISVGLSYLKLRNPRLDMLLEGASLIIVEDGKPLKQRLQKERIDEADILEAARLTQGLERMEQIKFAVLERNGKISIIPKERG
jgi:uncharacterized membrane protein YcaP (DUF421 family)